MDQDCRNQILSEDYADFMLKFGDTLDRLIAEQNICYEVLNYDTVVAYLPIATLPSNFIHLFGYGAIPNCYGLLDVSSVEASGINRVRNIAPFNLRGQGVLIGIVDTGIDYTHNAFKKADGTSKILSIWDQSIQSETSIPEGFNYGTEYSQLQLNLALTSEDPLSVVPSIDENGHGTFLAGIAAGTSSLENDFAGVAPDAELVVVKLKPAKQFLRDFWLIPQDVTCFQKNDLINGINYIIGVAKRVMRPLSLFIGIGTSQGGHDERGALSAYLSILAAQSGICLSLAAGNEGSSGHHYLGTVTREIQYDTVELRVGPNESGFSMELWGTAFNTFSIDLLSPSGEYIPRIPARIAETREIQFIFEETIIYIDYQLVEAQSGDQLVLVRFKNPTEGIWRFRVYAGGDLTLNYHIWLPMTQFLGVETYFTEPEPEYTLTSPGNTFVPIVVTAYNHTTDTLYINASRGYTRYDDIAPIIAAPGVNLIGPTFNNGYTVFSGTSVSTAHIAGVAAMFLEWGIVRGNYSQLNSVEIKNLLIRGARRSPNLTYPNKEWGYGILDLYGSYNSLRGGEGNFPVP